MHIEIVYVHISMYTHYILIYCTYMAVAHGPAGSSGQVLAGSVFVFAFKILHAQTFNKRQ